MHRRDRDKRNGLTRSPQIVDKLREEHLGGRDSPLKIEGTQLHISLLKGPVFGRGIPTTPGRENQQEFCLFVLVK